MASEERTRHKKDPAQHTPRREAPADPCGHGHPASREVPCQATQENQGDGEASRTGPEGDPVLEGLHRLNGGPVREHERDGCPHAPIHPAGDGLPGGERQQGQVPHSQHEHDPARPAEQPLSGLHRDFPSPYSAAAWLRWRQARSQRRVRAGSTMRCRKGRFAGPPAFRVAASIAGKSSEPGSRSAARPHICSWMRHGCSWRRPLQVAARCGLSDLYGVVHFMCTVTYK